MRNEYFDPDLYQIQTRETLRKASTSADLERDQWGEPASRFLRGEQVDGGEYWVVYKINTWRGSYTVRVSNHGRILHNKEPIKPVYWRGVKVWRRVPLYKIVGRAFGFEPAHVKQFRDGNPNNLRVSNLRAMTGEGTKEHKHE